MEEENINKNKIHKILAYSYCVYFLLFLFGILFEYFSNYNIKIFINNFYILFFFFLIILAKILIFWAQKT
jgi:hypothetical protein